MDTLATLKKASIAPVYEIVNFSDLHPFRTGSIRVRVNLTKKMYAEMQTVADLPEGAEKNERALAFVASLIPRDETGDEPLTTEEWKSFIEGGDADDVQFANALVDEIYRRIPEYTRRDFLASKPSATK